MKLHSYILYLKITGNVVGQVTKTQLKQQWRAEKTIMGSSETTIPHDKFMSCMIYAIIINYRKKLNLKIYIFQYTTTKSYVVKNFEVVRLKLEAFIYLLSAS